MLLVTVVAAPASDSVVVIFYRNQARRNGRIRTGIVIVIVIIMITILIAEQEHSRSFDQSPSSGKNSTNMMDDCNFGRSHLRYSKPPLQVVETSEIRRTRLLSDSLQRICVTSIEPTDQRSYSALLDFRSSPDPIGIWLSLIG